MVLAENYAAHRQKLGHTFNDPKRSNVVFEARDGQTFHCDKLILQVASPHFEKLFSCDNEVTKFVSAKDVDPSALKWILRSCYTGDGDLNDDNVVSVLLAAKLYEVDWVEKACMKYLKGGSRGLVASFEYSDDNQKWQHWKVPATDWYHIVAMGAKAKDQPHASAQSLRGKGGMGAITGGSFRLEASDNVQILTGGMSRDWYTDPKYVNLYTGGGGGTFVALKGQDLHLLMAAGGGGGIYGQLHGADANLGENGVGTTAKNVAGRNGGNGINYGAFKGGLGWKAGPEALAKPWGTSGSDSGGFGGGGACCGGGGGYSGGGPGLQGPNVSAGGGGSYVAPEAINSWKQLGSLGHGKVIIWRGKEMPPEEKFFLQQLGNSNERHNEEFIDTWEVLD